MFRMNITAEGLVPRDNDPFERYHTVIPTVKPVRSKGHRGTQLIGLKQTAYDLTTALGKPADVVAKTQVCLIAYLESYFNARYRDNIFREHGNEITKEGLIDALNAYVLLFVVCPDCGTPELQVTMNSIPPIRVCSACGHHSSVPRNKHSSVVLRRMFDGGRYHKKKRTRKKRSGKS